MTNSEKHCPKLEIIENATRALRALPYDKQYGRVVGISCHECGKLISCKATYNGIVVEEGQGLCISDLQIPTISVCPN